MVRYPEVWVADYLQNMRSRSPSTRKPELKQVSSNGERACRYRSHGRQTRSAYIFSVSNTDLLFDQSFNPFLPVDSPLFRRW